MLLRPIAFALALALPATAQAETRSDRFVDLMGRLPESVFANRSSTLPAFADLEAARIVLTRLSDTGQVTLSDSGLFFRVGPAPFRDIYPDADWTSTLGFSKEDLQAAAITNDSGTPATVLLLAPGVTTTLGPVLLANGYADDDTHGFPAWWRVAEDGAMDLSSRNGYDPFASSVPYSSRMAVSGDILFQSQTWPVLQAMMAQTGPNAVLTTMGEILDAPDWTDHLLVRATVFSNPLMFVPGLPTTLMLQDTMPTVESVAQEMEAMKPARTVPYWSNLLLADLSNGASDLTLLVLIYPAESDAVLAADILNEDLGGTVPLGSKETFEQRVGPGRVKVMGSGPYATVYAVETAPKIFDRALADNKGYDRIGGWLMQSGLPIFGPPL